MNKKIYIVRDITEILGTFSNKKAAWECACHHCPDNQGTDTYRLLCVNGSAYLFSMLPGKKAPMWPDDEWYMAHMKDKEIWIEECLLKSTFAPAQVQRLVDFGQVYGQTSKEVKDALNNAQNKKESCS